MNRPPVTPAAAAAALALLAVPERVPDEQSLLTVSVQQPIRRPEETDEIHAEELTYHVAVQGQVQLPPPVVQALPPGQQLFDLASQRDRWPGWEIAQATTMPRSAVLLDSPGTSHLG